MNAADRIYEINTRGYDPEPLEQEFTVAEQTLVDRVREYVRDGSGVGILLVEDMSDQDFADAPGQVGPSWQKTEQLDDRLTIEYRRAT